MRCVPATLALLTLAAALAGCGGGAGVEEGAIVSVYVEAPFCTAIGKAPAKAGSFEVEAICLPQAKNDLAIAGENARQATEDSAAVAYIQPPDSPTARFTHPILDAAGIGWTVASSPKRAMRQVLDAIESADAGSLRDQVREDLEAE